MYRSRMQQPPQAIDLQSIGAELRIYGEIDDPGMRHFNPSIAWHDNKLKIAIRSCNFAVERHGKWYFRNGGAYSITDVLYGTLNPDTLQVSSLQKLEISKDSPVTVKTAGLEDVRLFQRGKHMHAIGFESDRLTRSLHNLSAKLAEFLINGNELKYIRTLDKPDENVVEKNWSPSDIQSSRFDFTYSPTQVWKDGEVIGEKYTGDIHGGSQLLRQNDGTYLSIVHKKTINRMLGRTTVYDKFVYQHYLAQHDKDGIIIQLSKPFTFGTHENIEFVAGMVEHGDDLLISLGIRDCKWAIAKIKKAKLLELLDE